MDMLREIMLAACFTGAAISVAGSAAFGEKLRGQLGFLFSLIFALAVIAPIASGDTQINFNVAEFSEESMYRDASDEYNAQILKRVEDNLEKTAAEALAGAGIECSEIHIYANISEDNSISIVKASVACEDFDSARAVLSGILGSDVDIAEVVVDDADN